MAYYRKNVQVGWIDEIGRFYGMDTTCVDPGLTLTKCFAAVGEWYDDGFHCLFCNTYLGYEGRGRIDGKTACFRCEAAHEVES